MKKNYFKIPHVALESDNFRALSPSAAKLLWVMYKLTNRYSNETGWFYRSLQDLVTDTGISKPTIMRARDELIQSKQIDAYIDSTAYQSHNATLYRVKLPPELVKK